MTRTLLAVLLAAIISTSTASEGWGSPEDACTPPELDAGYMRGVEEALRARKDVWGSALLRARPGPTYEGAGRYLKPLLLALGPKGSRITDSGFHYLAFMQPNGADGSGSAALHVADGSQIVSQRADGRTLTVGVGRSGLERYGSCLGRLMLPRLAGGYLPILRTRYLDAHGARYTQESFAARTPGDESIRSFVQLTADARASRGDVAVRLVPPSGEGEGRTYLVSRGTLRTVFVTWPVGVRGSVQTLVSSDYGAARAFVIGYWQGRLTEGATIEVPDRRVTAAARNLLVQNLGLGWRYSIGNPYQQFSFPEGVDVAQVMAAYGFSRVSSAILGRALSVPAGPYRNWRIGQKLVGAAAHYRLFRDRSLVDAVTPAFRRDVEFLRSEIDAERSGLLGRERYSSDVPDLVYGLHSQAVVWQGLREMARVWRATGDRALAATSRDLAARLERGLRRALLRSQRRLDDGSLFVPVRLLDGEKPYDSVTESRAGSYWNLVAPYALASGLFAPGSREAEGVLRYRLLHGSRLLGLVRAGAYSLYGRAPQHPASGVNPVYGLNSARFLADNDRPDQLVLSLYGQLAAGMSPGTFVSGEAASVAPLSGERNARSMYLPPNSASNASFLENLRLMLVHETRSRAGAPNGLELAYATPRAWLSPGKTIAVQKMPTSFGPISFSIGSEPRSLRVSIEMPERRVPTVRLRLRLPPGRRIVHVLAHGRELPRLGPAGETVDLSGRVGRVDLVALVRD